MVEREPFLTCLRAILERSPADGSVTGVAGELALTPRGLQRRLRVLDVSFRGERDLARVRIAQRLLVDERQKVEVVAIEVGYAAVQPLRRLFRRVVGVGPAEWRRRELRGRSRFRWQNL